MQFLTTASWPCAERRCFCTGFGDSCRKGLSGLFRVWPLKQTCSMSSPGRRTIRCLPTYALLLIITTYLTLPYCTGRVCYRRHHSLLLLLLPLLLLLLLLLLLPPPPSPPPPPPRRLSLSPWTKQTHSAGLCTNGVAFNRSPSPASAALGGVRRIYLDRKRHTPALSSSSSITSLRLLFPRTSPALLSLTHRAL